MIIQAHMDMPRLAQYVFPGYPVVRHFVTARRMKRAMHFLWEPRNLGSVMRHLEINAEDSVLIHINPVVNLDFELTDPLAYYQALSKNRKIRYAKSLEKKILKLSREDFETFIKLSSLLKRWYKEIFGQGDKAYKLFAALAESKVAFIGQYFQMRETMSAPEILSALLTFLIKVRDRADNREMLSEYYQRVMANVRGQMKRLGPALEFLIQSKETIPLDLRIIQFILRLRGA